MEYRTLGRTGLRVSLLGLGSGGFDVVHVNLTRGLDGSGAEEATAMKLNYTSLQHSVEPVEARA
jgi:aryl-alcohol dehydrogenase-like predicted oxidoreductase